MDITQIPTDKLQDDKAASLADITFCEWAAILGITTYSGDNVQERFEINQKIVALIEAELTRRKEEA